MVSEHLHSWAVLLLSGPKPSCFITMLPAAAEMKLKVRGVFGSEGRRSRSDKKTQESSRLPGCTKSSFTAYRCCWDQLTCRPGSAHIRVRAGLSPASACISLLKGFLPTGPVLPTPALSASPLGHSHVESLCHVGLFTPAPQSAPRGLSPVTPRGERPDNTLGLASRVLAVVPGDCPPTPAPK